MTGRLGPLAFAYVNNVFASRGVSSSLQMDYLIFLRKREYKVHSLGVTIFSVGFDTVEDMHSQWLAVSLYPREEGFHSPLQS
jgi:hypothetical protein